MAKPRLKRYQSGGKVKHYVTGGTAGDESDDAEIKPQATPDAVETPSAPVSSTPPHATPVSGTRAVPMTGAQVASARNVRAARTLPATNPATALKTPSPPFGNTASPTASVGGNQAVINTPYGPAKQPVIDPMANARALDAGARQTSTGYGSGAAPVGSVRSGPTPSGGFASSGATKPIEPTQPAGQTAIAGPNVARPRFVYGGRVANNTLPKKVGMQKPMPFMHGGKVKMWSGGRVRKMQSGGVTPVPEHEDQDETPQTPLTPQDMAARQRLTTRVNESNRASTMNEKPRYRMGGRVSPVRRMQSGGAVDDRRDLLADADNSFYGGGNNPKPSPTPTPKPGFINRVKGVAKAIADRTGFQKGGRVRPVPRTKAAPKMPMMNDADADDMPLKMQDGGGVPRIDDPAHTTEPPSPLRYQMKSGGKLPPDNVPAMLGKGEVVLNKNQQKRVAVKPGWQNGLNPKEKSAMSEMRLPRMRKQHAMTGKSVPRIFGGK